MAFYVVYIQEAHATDAWQVGANLRDQVLIPTATSLEDRSNAAGACARKLGIEFPALVDNFQNSTEAAYTGWPDRLYVIDRNGRIAHKSGPGPYGFKPRGVAESLKKLVGIEQGRES